jgi:hypothetical protein
VAEPRFNVVFRGETAEGWDPATVKEQMVARLGMTRAAAERFFSIPLVIIRNQADRQTATKYVQAFASVGIICRLESVDLPTDAQSGRARVAWQGMEDFEDAAADPPATTICPKCGHTQATAEECARCGIVFSKYHPAYGNRLSSSIKSASISFYDIARERRQLVVLAVLMIILAGLVYHLITTREIKHLPGILVASEPEQVVIRNSKPWQMEHRLVVPLAHFRLQARVLSSERYRFDSVSDLSPIDLALGWGPMSDQRVLDQLEIGQGSRRYVVLPSHDRPPLPMHVLMANSANMHLLPASDEIKKKLFTLRRGNLIDLTGYLVGIRENGQWTWVSSLSRTDTGDGSCEIVWVERLDVR